MSGRPWLSLGVGVIQLKVEKACNGLAKRPGSRGKADSPPRTEANMTDWKTRRTIAALLLLGAVAGCSDTNSTSGHGEAPGYQTVADTLRIVVASGRIELEGRAVALEDLDGDLERTNERMR